ncbi:hypothetical protein A7M48_18845 [Acinetobacter baumannii]|nr:hypothetical protein A7M48_18845 [Acinetobacter baumannii]
MCSNSNFLVPGRKRLETAHVDTDLSVLSVDAAEGFSLVVGELVHGTLGEVEASAGAVDGEDVDGVAVVSDAVAGTALLAVPAFNALVSTNVRKVLDGSQCLKSVAPDQTVFTI